MQLIQARIESGQTDAPDETPVAEIAAGEKGDVIDIMALLKRSVEATGRGERIAADTERAPAAKKPKKAAAAKAEPAPAAAAAEDDAFPWEDDAPRQAGEARPRGRQGRQGPQGCGSAGKARAPLGRGVQAARQAAQDRLRGRG